MRAVLMMLVIVCCEARAAQPTWRGRGGTSPYMSSLSMSDALILEKLYGSYKWRSYEPFNYWSGSPLSVFLSTYFVQECVVVILSYIPCPPDRCLVAAVNPDDPDITAPRLSNPGDFQAKRFHVLSSGENNLLKAYGVSVDLCVQGMRSRDDVVSLDHFVHPVRKVFEYSQRKLSKKVWMSFSGEILEADLPQPSLKVTTMSMTEKCLPSLDVSSSFLFLSLLGYCDVKVMSGDLTHMKLARRHSLVVYDNEKFDYQGFVRCLKKTAEYWKSQHAIAKLRDPLKKVVERFPQYMPKLDEVINDTTGLKQLLFYNPDYRFECLGDFAEWYNYKKKSVVKPYRSNLDKGCRPNVGQN